MVLRLTLFWIAALFVAGCTDEVSDDDSSGPGESDLFDELDVTVSDLVGTYVDIQWSTGESAPSFLEYGTDTSYGTRVEASAEAADSHQINLPLLIAGTEYHFRLGVAIDGEERYSEDHTFTTAAPPLALPELTWIAEDPERVTPGFMATGIIGTEAAAVVIDNQGRYRWWSVEENEDGLITTVLPSTDGASVLFNLFWNDNGSTAAKIIRKQLDGTESERWDVPEHHHNFVELPDGTLAAIVFDTIVVEGDKSVKGDKIVELDGNGSQEIWSVWDVFEWVDYPHPEGTGWSHSNALAYDDEEGMYYLGLRQQSCVVKIDRATGDVQWILGTSESDFEANPDDRFNSQHHFQLLDDGILIFDNGSTDVLNSRAVEYELDTADWTAEQRWEWAPTPSLYVLNLGDVERFESGNTLVTLSSAGQIVEVTAEGDVLSEIHTPIGSAFAYVHWFGESAVGN